MKRAFTLIELLVVLAICAIMVSIATSAYKNFKRPSKAGEESVGPPRPPSAPRAAAILPWKFYTADGVLAAEVSQVLSNAGYRLRALEDGSVNIQRK